MMTTIWNIVAAFFFRLSLDWANYNIISPKFAAFGMPLDPNPTKLLESYILLAIVAFFAPKKSTISSIIIWLFIAISYVPCLTLYGFSNMSRYWMYSLTAFWLLSCFLVKPFKKLFPVTKYRFKVSQSRLFIFLGSLSLYSLLAILSSSGLRLTLNFVDIYDIRSAFSPILPLAAYIITWSYCVVNPLLIVSTWMNRKRAWMLALIAFQLFIAATTGQKVVLFSLPFILGITWLKEKNWLKFSTINMALGVLVLLSCFSWFVLGDKWASATITMRLFLLPGMISFFHYDFFSTNPPALLGHSFFGNFVSYPYEDLPWYVIGNAYWDSDMSANAGLVPDAYMNFREIGLVAVLLLFVSSLAILDGFAQKRNPRLVLSAVLMSYYWSMNGSFFSSILTAGLGLALLVLFSLPNLKSKVTPKSRSRALP